MAQKKGFKHTKESIDKIKKGKKNSVPWNKGKRGLQSGENSPNWKGGISKKDRLIRNSADYILWRLKVFTRDNFTCQGCGIIGCYLEAHHIKSFAKYPKLRFEVSNGVTLCTECHEKVDKYRRKFKHGNN